DEGAISLPDVGILVVRVEVPALELQQHTQAFRIGQAGIVGLQDLAGMVVERDHLPLPTDRTGEEQPVVIQRLHQTRQHPDNRGADGAQGAIFATGDAHHLVGTMSRTLGITDGAVLLPEGQHVVLQLGGDLLPYRGNIEGNGRTCTHGCPALEVGVRGVADRPPVERSRWTSALYSSNSSFWLRLRSASENGGAIAPARLSRTMFEYSIRSM